MSKIFLMTCIRPTQTLIKDKKYRVIDYDETKQLMTVVNESGINIQVLSSRFKNIEMKSVETKKIICIRTGNYSNITAKKTYVLEKEDKSFYFIRNDKKIYSRYGKKYFTKIDEAPIEVEKPKKDIHICIIPSTTLTYGKKYEFLKTKTKDGYVCIVDDEKEKIMVLKKRFK